MKNKTSFLEKIPDCITPLYEDIEHSCDSEYISIFWSRKNKEKRFFNKCNTCINEDFFTKINSALGEEYNIANPHPILGVAYNQSSYSQVPLYRHLNPTEPQLTKALSDFLSENQTSCKAFVQAILELLNENKADIASLPDDGYTCRSEVFTTEVKNEDDRRKRIDNIIMWNKRALCIEVKFDATIKNNDLNIYKKHMKKMTSKETTITYVAISIYNIQYEIDKKGCSDWKNLLWADVLRTWEKILANNNSDEDIDLKRYRSSLWRKVLCIGENEDVD